MTKNTLFEAIKETDNYTTTANGMTANKSTLSAVLNLFGQGATCRNDLKHLTNLVLDAYSEDKLVTLRTLFYFRDIRGNSGQGEREIFRNSLFELAKIDAKTIAKVIKHIPFYGRWDDMLYLWGASEVTNEAIREIVIRQLMEDQEALNEKNFAKISLLGKWMPSINTSSKKTRDLARRICSELLGQTPRNYRKMLSGLREALNIVERHISKKEYDFDYSKIPGAAMKKYGKAFARNDTERWNEYLKKLNAVTSIAYQRLDIKFSASDFGYTEEELKGVKANTKNLYPYEIIEKLCNFGFSCGYDALSDAELSMYNSMWKNQKNYFTGDSANENWLAVADVSGSMYGRPITVAISLAMYIAEHNKGLFANKYMTYSESPRLVEIERSWDLKTKINRIANEDVGYNTDLIKVFRTVLDAATKHKLPQEEMPSTIVIISDMQFDSYQMRNTDGRSFSIIRNMYEKAGYTMPKLVYWNAADVCYDNVPVTVNDRGVMLLSGCKPGMFEQMMQNVSPLEFMLSVVNDARYQMIEI